MKNKLLTNYEAANDAYMLLAAGASKWTQRTYEINFSVDDYVKAQKQMKKQDERKDDIILLKVDYNIMAGKAMITDKVCTCR